MQWQNKIDFLIILQLAEVTADLAEEHDTATHATEMLEAETADRMRLDKELKDVQVSRYNIMFEFWLIMM